jgi:hypothetical protein
MESTHFHPDQHSAFKKLGITPCKAPQSGIGQDPRKKFEDATWTEAEKVGHQASVQKIRSTHEASDRRAPWVPPGNVDLI